MLTTAKSRVDAVMSNKSAHTVYFEADLDTAGFVIVNLPVHRWFEMGEPAAVVITIEGKEADEG